MGWSGAWNTGRTVYTGTYTARDGSVFAGTWTVSRQGSATSDPPQPATPATPPLSDYDPYTGGIGPRVDDADSTSHRPR